jgi:hypothetical protein
MDVILSGLVASSVEVLRIAPEAPNLIFSSKVSQLIMFAPSLHKLTVDDSGLSVYDRTGIPAQLFSNLSHPACSSLRTLELVGVHQSKSSVLTSARLMALVYPRFWRFYL